MSERGWRLEHWSRVPTCAICDEYSPLMWRAPDGEVYCNRHALRKGECPDCHAPLDPDGRCSGLRQYCEGTE